MLLMLLLIEQLGWRPAMRRRPAHSVPPLARWAEVRRGKGVGSAAVTPLQDRNPRAKVGLLLSSPPWRACPPPSFPCPLSPSWPWAWSRVAEASCRGTRSLRT